jgi:hypothetical protein
MLTERGQIQKATYLYIFWRRQHYRDVGEIKQLSNIKGKDEFTSTRMLWGKGIVPHIGWGGSIQLSAFVRIHRTVQQSKFSCM